MWVCAFFYVLKWAFLWNNWNSILDWICEHSTCKIYYILCIKYVEKRLLCSPYLWFVHLICYFVHLIFDFDHHRSLQNHTLIVLFMDRINLHGDGREHKSSLIICPVQFNLSLLSWPPSAFYFPWTLNSILIVWNAISLLCHFQPGDLKYKLK